MQRVYRGRPAPQSHGSSPLVDQVGAEETLCCVTSLPDKLSLIEVDVDHYSTVADWNASHLMQIAGFWRYVESLRASLAIATNRLIGQSYLY